MSFPVRVDESKGTWRTPNRSCLYECHSHGQNGDPHVFKESQETKIKNGIPRGHFQISEETTSPSF